MSLETLTRRVAALEARLAELEGAAPADHFTAVYGHLAGLKAEVAELREEMIERFAGVDAQFDRIEGLLLKLAEIPPPPPGVSEPPLT